MAKMPKVPQTHLSFVGQFPELGKAWELTHEAGARGPLDERTQRLVRLAVALGAMREGAVHSSVRKALAEGITREEIDQVVALAAGTLGLPSTVAVWTWTHDQSGAPDGDARDSATP